MTTFTDLKEYFQSLGYKVIIVSEAEPRVSVKTDEGFSLKQPGGGGVSVALEPVAKASDAVYIGRARHKEEMDVVDSHGKLHIQDHQGNYTLKRLYFNDDEVDAYYNGYANQTLWPLCHVAFQKPIFNKDWYEGYKHVNHEFARAIKEEIDGKTFVFINDYQLSLVPLYLGRPKDTIVSMFWHIPWPTWEIFRILPDKRDILWSLLSTDFLAFHRGYQARNFIDTVEREFETRVDRETNKVYFNKGVTTVKALPMGIDTDVIEGLLNVPEQDSVLAKLIKDVLEIEEKTHPLAFYFDKYRVMFGLDRLDYTKGVDKRLSAVDRFFEKYPEYLGKVVYLGIMAPSRSTIPAYAAIAKDVKKMARDINTKYATKSWKPIHLINSAFPREEVLELYKKAAVCLVTPLDDGMNLVSKEYVTAAGMSQDPGMLVLSQFAGSAIDLTQALIVNPYDTEQVADSIKKALDMPQKEKVERTHHMVDTLHERNVYEWAEEFIKGSVQARRGV